MINNYLTRNVFVLLINLFNKPHSYLSRCDALCRTSTHSDALCRPLSHCDVATPRQTVRLSTTTPSSPFRGFCSPYETEFLISFRIYVSVTVCAAVDPFEAFWSRSNRGEGLTAALVSSQEPRAPVMTQRRDDPYLVIESLLGLLHRRRGRSRMKGMLSSFTVAAFSTNLGKGGKVNR
jgi:hypothetical protein